MAAIRILGTNDATQRQRPEHRNGISKMNAALATPAAYPTPFVQWILAIPHLIIANAINSLSEVVAFISWFIILFTGRLPIGTANLQGMALRYQARTTAYATFLHDQYPAFEFEMIQDEPGGDATIINIPVQTEDRNRLTVGLRFFMLIPFMVIGFIWALVAVNLHRWFLRVSSYATLLRDEYPPIAI
jgi:hypothetical protein